MRSAFIYTILFIIIGCTTIDKLEPNQTKTFLKFYSESNTMKSKDLKVLEDGYLILSTYNNLNTMLLKTDLLGNKLWAQSFNEFQGTSLELLDDGYIMIGDGINDQNDSTYMQLIKTDFNGTFINLTNVGTGAQHGTAVMLTSANEIIGLGYTSTGQLNDSDDSTYVIFTGFDTNLVQTWDTVRTKPVLNVDIVPSKSIYEADNGFLTWISYSSQDEVTTNINFTAIPRDSETPGANPPLFNDYSLTNNPGDFVKTPVGYSLIQTVIEDGISKIGIITSINGTTSDEKTIELSELNPNIIAESITNTSNGLLIVASIENTESGRDDMDLLLLEVDYKGFVKSNGININYGGNGNEIPVRVRRTNDGGYAVLGTLENSKGAELTFLLKTNSKGELE